MPYTQTTLWKTAFPSSSDDGFNEQRQKIAQAYKEFRANVEQLLKQIQKDLPELTLHDISHVDALWDVASEIAGPDYPLNPAEALVLGGAFLLHDAAHCLAAYPKGVTDLRQTNEWRDAVGLLKSTAPTFATLEADLLKPGQEGFEQVLFATLRVLHPKHAKTLPVAKWTDANGDVDYLFPHTDLRLNYGGSIGLVAESHWWDPHALEAFAKQNITAPTCLGAAPWDVDLLKVAVLLRVADACHMDARRAPRFLMLLKKPEGVSAQHWLFQSKLRKVRRDDMREDLSISGLPFGSDEQQAWWLAFETINWAHKELQAADALLRDHNKPRLKARAFDGAHKPERFAQCVSTAGWVPVDTSLRVSNIQSVVERFGGKALYGDKPWCALRELLQNARDAIHAARSLGFLDAEQGKITVSTEDADGGKWLHVQDDGVGMSRYVLTEVLLDFGRSLWRTESLRGEWSGLAGSGFEAIGQFGIGFFSIFMLGDKVVVRTRRQEAKDADGDQGWELNFEQGLRSRPLLTRPREPMRKRGTRVSVWMTNERYEQLLSRNIGAWMQIAKNKMSLQKLCAWLGPALDIDVLVSENNLALAVVVKANDWLSLSDFDLAQRINPSGLNRFFIELDGEEGFNFYEPLNYEGRCVGRITLSTYTNYACGVIKGLRAGNVGFISGLVFVRSQGDLARNTAIPDVSLPAIQEWSNSFNSRIKQSQEEGDDLAGRLIRFGVAVEDLSEIGLLGGRPVSYDSLTFALRSMLQVRLHDGKVIHSSIDGVIEDDFEAEFRAMPDLLETFSSPDVDWLKELPQKGLVSSDWSFETLINKALKEAWGSNDISVEGIREQVGKVDGGLIYRNVQVITRKS